MLADLHDVYDQYASKQVKQIMESTDGRAYSNGTYDGTFVGLPNVAFIPEQSFDAAVTVYKTMVFQNILP